MSSATGAAFAKRRPEACGLALRRPACSPRVAAFRNESAGGRAPTPSQTALAATHICSAAHFEDAGTLFVPEWLNRYAACYEIKTKFIIRIEANTAADITSEEGVHQGFWASTASVYLLLA